jgi:hypothetical protein
LEFVHHGAEIVWEGWGKEGLGFWGFFSVLKKDFIVFFDPNQK